MLLQELYDYYGSWTNIGRKLDMGHSNYSAWRRKGYIPYTTQCVIEKKTKGLFKAQEEHGKAISKQ